MPYNAFGGNVTRAYQGRILMKKLFGAGPLAVGAVVAIPFGRAMPRNPKNNSYLSGVNASAYLSGFVAGKKTPSISISTVLKASFWTANFLTSLVLARDANGDTDVWSVYLDDTVRQDVYDGAKCAGLQLRQSASGGPIVMNIAMIAQYGDSENPGTLYPLTTFGTSTTDNGQAIDVSKVQYGGTADKTIGLALDIICPQGYVMYDDGTLFPAGIASGMATGNLTVTQSTQFTTSPTTSATVNIGSAGAGVSLAIAVNNDEDVRDLNTGPRMLQRSFTLYDSVAGGSPLVATAM